MALSNIFREPRREITESVVGLAVGVSAIWADYEFAIWFKEATGSINGGCPWPLGMLLGAIFAFLLVMFVFATHALGDGICDALQSRGIHLRPRYRP